MQSEVVMLVMLCRIVGIGPLTELQLQVLHKVPVQKTEQDILQEVGYQAGRKVVNFSWAMNEWFVHHHHHHHVKVHVHIHRHHNQQTNKLTIILS